MTVMRARLSDRVLPSISTAMAPTYDRTGFANDSVNRDKLKALVARHLETIRNRSVETALASLTTQEATQ